MVKINEKNQLLLNPLGAIQNGFRGVFSKVSPRFSVKDMRKEKRINKTVNIYYQDQQLLGEWTVNKTVNISNEGACIIVDHPLIKGKGIILEIGHVNHGHRQVMRIIGTIVDVSKRDGSGYLCRIVFKQKSTRMHQKKNFLWKLADFNLLWIDMYTKDYQCYPSENIDQIKTAYQMIYQEYLKRKLCVSSERGMLCNPYCFVPSTRVFVLEKKNAIHGSVSLIPDSPFGLPMDSIFQNELDQLRSQGRKLAEVGALALNSDHFNKSSYSFTNLVKQGCLFKLYKTMFNYARSGINLTDLIIGCHPKHEFLYKYIAFERLSEPRSYPGANKAPAILMRFNIDDNQRFVSLINERPTCYFYKESKKIPMHRKEYKMPVDFVREHLVGNKEIWENLSRKQQEYLLRCYALDKGLSLNV